jgi:hypothetical protein
MTKSAPSPRGFVAAGEAAAQVEERRLDLVAVRGEVVDEFAGRGEALLDDPRVGLDVVDLGLACDAADIQIGLEHGLEVVWLFRVRQVRGDELRHNPVDYVFYVEIQCHCVSSL